MLIWHKNNWVECEELNFSALLLSFTYEWFIYSFQMIYFYILFWFNRIFFPVPTHLHIKGEMHLKCKNGDKKI